MDALLNIGIANALVAGMISIAAAGAAWLGARPAMVHALWVLAIAKLLTPPVVAVRLPVEAHRWSAGSDLSASPASVAVDSPPAHAVAVEVEAPAAAPADATEPYRAAAAPAPQGSSASPSRSTSGSMEIPRQAAPAPQGSPALPTAGTLRNIDIPRRLAALPWGKIIACVWGAGSVLCAGAVVVRTARFQRLVRFSRPADDGTMLEMRRAGRLLNLRHLPAVRMIDGAVCPMLWCIGRPAVLLLPDVLWQRLSANQRMLLLTHELAHWKRRDHWVRLMEVAAAVLYWWHPTVWFGRRALREAEEQCCDAWVVWAAPDCRRHYAAALMETLDFVAAGASAPAAACGVTYFRGMSRRLTMIMRANAPRGLSISGRLFAGLAALLLLPLVPLAGGERPDGARDADVRPEREGDALAMRERNDAPRAESREGARQEGERRDGELRDIRRRDGERSGGEDRPGRLREDERPGAEERPRESRDGAKARQRLIGGEFLKFEDGAAILLVGDGARQVAVPVPPETPVTLDGAAVKINDVPAGAFMQIALLDGLPQRVVARSPRGARKQDIGKAADRPGEGKEVPARQRDEAGEGRRRVISGIIEHVDDDDIDLSVGVEGEGGKVRQVCVSTGPQTEVFINGRSSDLEDLKPGMRVSVMLAGSRAVRIDSPPLAAMPQPEGRRGEGEERPRGAGEAEKRGEGQRMAGEAAERPRRGLRGWVVRVDPPGNVVMRIPFEGALHQVAVMTTEQTEVITPAGKASLTDLKPGQLVVVYQTDGQTVRIEAMPGERR